MDNAIISDNMQKESKVWKKPMILFFTFSAIFPFSLIWNDLKVSEFVLGEFFFILVGSYFLYVYLYLIRYQIIISNEKIILRTLFRKVELNMDDIINYTYKKYRKTVFYQFKFSTKAINLMISTRYKDQMIDLLKENNIIEKVK